MRSASSSFVLRAPEAGDLGWIVHRQAILYSQEYGLNQRFEATVARVVAEFVDTFDPAAERCWIAERAGEVIGSVFLVRTSAEVARLRLLYVEPSARGLGLGRHLVQQCMQQARAFGYQRMTLWTHRELEAARRIYAAEGWRLVSEEAHDDFGPTMTGEIWDVTL